MIPLYPQAMASTDTSLEAAEGSVSERGFYCWQDTPAGDRISEFAKKGFPYFTEYGLDFLSDFAFNPASSAPRPSSQKLTSHSAFDAYWKPISTAVSSHTGSDTKRYLVSILNASGKVGPKLDGGSSWSMCVRKGHKSLIMLDRTFINSKRSRV